MDCVNLRENECAFTFICIFFSSTSISFVNYCVIGALTKDRDTVGEKHNARTFKSLNNGEFSSE